MPRSIAQIHEDAPASSFRQLSLSLQFALGRLDLCLQEFLDLRLALEDQTQRVLGNDQQHDFGFGDDRGGLLRGIQRRELAERLALSRRTDRVLRPSSSRTIRTLPWRTTYSRLSAVDP